MRHSTVYSEPSKGDEAEETEAEGRFDRSPLKGWLLVASEVPQVFVPMPTAQQGCLASLVPAQLTPPWEPAAPPAPGQIAQFTAAVGSCCFSLSCYNSSLIRIPPASHLLWNKKLHVSACDFCCDIWVHLLGSWELVVTLEGGERMEKRERKIKTGQEKASLQQEFNRRC